MNMLFDWPLWIGYALSPILFWFYISALKTNDDPCPYIVAASILWLLSAIKAHWIVYGPMLLYSWLVYDGLIALASRDYETLSRDLKRTLCVSAIYGSLSAYWILPYLSAMQMGSLGPTFLLSLETLRSLSGWDSLHTFTLQSIFWPVVQATPQQPAFRILWISLGLVTPGLAFSAVILFPKDRLVRFFTILACVSAALTMGLGGPLSFLYRWLILESPIASEWGWLFRASGKWNVFLGLSYSFLVGNTVVWILERLASVNIVRIRLRAPRLSAKTLRTLLVVLLSFSSLLYCWPALTGDLNGALSPVKVPDEILETNAWLEKKEGDFKVSWIPPLMSLPKWQLNWNKYPVTDFYSLSSSKPSIGQWTPFSGRYYRFLYEDLLTNNRTSHMNRLLGFAGTRYVVYHDDLRRNNSSQDRPKAVIETLSKQRGAQSTFQKGFVNVYEVSTYAPRIYVSDRATLVVGGLDALNSLAYTDTSFCDSPVIFVEQLPLLKPTLEKLSALNHSFVIYGSKNLDDLWLSLSMSELKYVLAPYDSTVYSEAENCWNRLNIYSQEYDTAAMSGIGERWVFDYGRGLVHASRPTAKIVIPISLDESGTYRLYVRALQSPRSGRFSISIDGYDEALIDSRASFLNGLCWFEAGRFRLEKGSHAMKITNLYGENTMNLLALIPSNVIDAHRDFAMNIMRRSRIVHLFEAEASLTYDPRLTRVVSGSQFSAGYALESRTANEPTLEIEILKDSTYAISLRGSSPKPVGVYLDRSLILESGSHKLGWLKSNPVRMTAGKHILKIKASEGFTLDSLAVFSMVDKVDNYANAPCATMTRHSSESAYRQYKELGPTKVSLDLTIQKPVLLIFAEAFDARWILRVGERQATSIPAFSFINAFYVDDVGSHNVVIEYTPQQMSDIGVLISSLALACIVAFSAVRARRTRKRSSNRSAHHNPIAADPHMPPLCFGPGEPTHIYDSFSPEIYCMVGENKKVLDVGCATARLAGRLRSEKGCFIVGIEKDRCAAEIARDNCDQLIVGDIETLDTIPFPENFFDIIVFGDVLEHLHFPKIVLSRLRKYLSDDGYIIASIPNVANWRVRFQLFFGRFEYTDGGLLDRNHVRFYTLKTARRLIEESGFNIVRITNYNKLILKLLGKAWKTLFAYTFIIKAVKSK